MGVVAVLRRLASLKMMVADDGLLVVELLLDPLRLQDDRKGHNSIVLPLNLASYASKYCNGAQNEKN